MSFLSWPFGEYRHALAGLLSMMIVVAVVFVKRCESHDQTDGSEDEYEQVAKYCQDDKKNNKRRDISKSWQRS
jgi:hypothetical protein